MLQSESLAIPVMRPQLPTADRLLPYLERIDQARTYSNFGPLYQEFSEKLAAYFGVESEQIALVANGTLALQAAVETIGEIGDTWVLPSFTFVASGQSVLAARRRIHFVDVEDDTWAVAPTQRPFARGHMVVAPFGSKPAVSAWAGISGPKIFDAASCFDACKGIGAELADDSMLMVSLHATKTLPAGEGAVLIGPPEWVKKSAHWANFGFAGSRFASGPGMNAKMSEYHAAVGLASLDSWPEDLLQWQRAMGLALAASAACGLEVQPSFRQGYVTSTWNVRLPQDADLGQVMKEMADRGVATRSWWPAGVNAMPAFGQHTVEALPMTEALVASTLGLPFGRGLGETDFFVIPEVLKASLGRSS